MPRHAKSPVGIRHSSLVIRHWPARRGREGFALLITITLVAFLVLLLVALSTLTRVETTVATNSQAQAQARQNALTALNIAIGQLQKYTGPDQRVTATADIAAAADGTRLPAGAAAQNTAAVNGTGNGLAAVSGSSIQAGTRWWTGVWGRAGPSYAIPASSVYDQTPSPVLLNWLVSGNEDLAFTIDATGTVSGSSASADLPANTARFTPGAPVDWTAGGLDAASPAGWTDTTGYADIEIKTSGQKAVLLVGPKSAGTQAVSGEAAVERYVVAPLQDITVASSTVPGAASTGNTTIGRYGWWIGDEGVKASYTISDPHPGQNTPDANSPAGDESRLRLMSASRSGIELVTGWSDYPAADDTTAAPRLSQLINLQQATLLTPTLTPQDQRASFHDFAPLSRGLLTDTLNGGLRTDLTYYFENSAAWNSSPLRGQGIIPASHSPDWSATGASNHAPKWDWLYSFYNTNPGVSSPALTVRPETATDLGISPVIAQLRMIFFTEDARITNPKNLPAGQTFNLPMRCNVAIVLANPYNATLTIPAGAMEFLIKNDVTGSAGVRIHAADGAGKGTELARFGVLRSVSSPETEGLLDTVKFSIPALSIPAGETVTLAVQGNSQVLGATNAPDAEPVNTIALAVRDGSNPIVSTDYFTGDHTLDFTTTTAGAGIALFQSAADLSVTLRHPAGDIYQRIEHFAINKNNQVNSFSGTVLGTAHVRFIAPARRTMDWSSDNLTTTLPYYVYSRPYIDFNIRAGRITHPNIHANSAGTTYVLQAPPSYGSGAMAYAAGGNAGGNLFAAFNNNLYPAQWTEDFSDDLRQAALQGVLFDFPRRGAAQPPITSLAQLQHANLATNDEAINGTIGFGSTYTIGNSYHNPFVTRGQSVQTRPNLYTLAPGGTSGSTRYFDLSYLLNTALWDRYFFSGVPQSGPDFDPLNLRYGLVDDTVTATDVRAATAAEHLTVEGAFNLNSTSKNAWIALLGGLNGRRVNDDSTAAGVPFPRTLWQPEDSELQPSNTYQTSGTGDPAYAGYRRLTPTEIDALATEIVKRVRARGPFVSLSHFINRSLVPASSDFNPSINDANGAGDLAASAVPMGRGLSGPLQAAIDSAAANINTFITVAGDRVTADGVDAYGDRVLFNGEIANSLNHKPNDDNNRLAYFADKQFDAPHTEWDMTESAPPGPNGRTSMGIPGWLLQADVLQAIGPALSPRSDTFIIRTYGETVNPFDSTQTLSRAWCEAVVQRFVDYVDPTNTPDAAPSTLSATNQSFGRAYKVISFRWLSADDI